MSAVQSRPTHSFTHLAILSLRYNRVVTGIVTERSRVGAGVAERLGYGQQRFGAAESDGTRRHVGSEL